MLGNDGQEWQLEYIQWILNLIGKKKGQSQFNLYPDDTSSSESGLFKKRSEVVIRIQEKRMFSYHPFSNLITPSKELNKSHINIHCVLSFNVVIQLDKCTLT